MKYTTNHILFELHSVLSIDNMHKRNYLKFYQAFDSNFEIKYKTTYMSAQLFI